MLCVWVMSKKMRKRGRGGHILCACVTEQKPRKLRDDWIRLDEK